MNAFVRLVSALLLMSLKTVTFGASHQYLPAKPRLSSPGFISLVVAFSLTSSMRYLLVEGHPGQQSAFLQAQVLYLGMLILLARQGLVKELALYLASSTGVDLVMAALGILGFDTQAPVTHDIGFYWEWLAAFVAIARMRLAQKRATPTSSAE